MSRQSNDTRGTDNASLVMASPASFEGLEGRRLMAVSSVAYTGFKLFKLPDTDGTSLNSNKILVAFSKTIRVADASLINTFGYAANLADASGTTQVKARVGLTITRSDEDPRVLQIITDRLIRKGSRLTIPVGALKDTSGNDIVYDNSSKATTITFTKGQNKARYSLANRNFQPGDLSYVDKAVFSAAPTATTASSAPSSTTIRANLVTFLNAKVGTGPGKITAAQVTSALATYDSSATAAIVPSANLRAALVSLVGTVAEPAIGSYLTKSNVTKKPYTVVDFGTVSSGTPVGETKLSPGGRLSLTINSTFAGEPFQVLSATLGHEILHQDNTFSTSQDLPTSQDEEIVANAVETIVWGQQLLIDPSIAGNATKLVVRTNTRLLALLNSGDGLFPYGGIFAAPALRNQGNVFPGAINNPGGFAGAVRVPSFENWIRREYISRGFSAGGTTASPTAQTILKNIVGDKNVTQLGSDTEKALDTNDTILVDTAYVALAQALKLRYGA